MRLLKRAGALSLALLLLISSLAACGKPGAASSSSGSSTPGASSSAPAGDTPITVDLSTITDVFLTTTGLSHDTVVATAGKTDITVGELMYWVAYSADNLLNYYSMYGMTELPWDMESDGATLAQTILKNSLNTAALYALLPEIAKTEGVTLSQEFQDTFQASLTSMTEALGGEAYMNMYLWQYPLSPDLYTQLCQSEDLNSQIQDKYFGETGSKKPTDADVLKYVEQDLGYYRFKHILLKTVDTTKPITNEDGSYGYESLGEDVEAQQKAAAEEILSQLQSAADLNTTFDALMQEHSEDTGADGSVNSPEGYLGATDPSQGKTMDPAVEEAAMALAEGELSGLVKGTYGYHIILRLPLAVTADEYRETYIADQMAQIQQSWLDANSIQTNDVYDKLDVPTFYQTVSALRDAVASYLEAQNPDSSASGSTPAASGSTADPAGSAPAASTPGE